MKTRPRESKGHTQPLGRRRFAHLLNNPEAGERTAVTSDFCHIIRVTALLSLSQDLSKDEAAYVLHSLPE